MDEISLSAGPRFRACEFSGVVPLSIIEKGVSEGPMSPEQGVGDSSPATQSTSATQDEARSNREKGAHGALEKGYVETEGEQDHGEDLMDPRRQQLLNGCPIIPREEWENHDNYKTNVGHFLRFHNNFRVTLDTLVKQPSFGAYKRLYQNLHTHHRIEESILFPFVEERYRNTKDEKRMQLLR